MRSSCIIKSKWPQHILFHMTLGKKSQQCNMCHGTNIQHLALSRVSPTTHTPLDIQHLQLVEHAYFMRNAAQGKKKKKSRDQTSRKTICTKIIQNIFQQVYLPTIQFWNRIHYFKIWHASHKHNGMCCSRKLSNTWWCNVAEQNAESFPRTWIKMFSWSSRLHSNLSTAINHFILFIHL